MGKAGCLRVSRARKQSDEEEESIKNTKRKRNKEDEEGIWGLVGVNRATSRRRVGGEDERGKARKGLRRQKARGKKGEGGWIMGVRSVASITTRARTARASSDYRYLTLVLLVQRVQGARDWENSGCARIGKTLVTWGGTWVVVVR